jgi:hypothetical protein
LKSESNFFLASSVRPCGAGRSPRAIKIK